jgi:hypothetical protein
MQRKGLSILSQYERAAAVLKTLYIFPVDNMLCCAPRIPCYGNTSGQRLAILPSTARTALSAVLGAEKHKNDLIP